MFRGLPKFALKNKCGKLLLSSYLLNKNFNLLYRFKLSLAPGSPTSCGYYHLYNLGRAPIVTPLIYQWFNLISSLNKKAMEKCATFISTWNGKIKFVFIWCLSTWDKHWFSIAVSRWYKDFKFFNLVIVDFKLIY